MCIIIYKPAGVELPGTKTLAQCFRSNPDGAGFMYPTEDGEVQVVKGLMSFSALTRALDAQDFKDVELVVHFRIGTQGSRDTKNTHPFIVTDDEAVLEATLSTGKVALAHNGIIPLTTDYSSKHSDTFHFVQDFASLICDAVKWYKHSHKVELLGRLAESKLAVMSADAHVELIGHFIEDKGCYYSNGTYKPWSEPTRTYPAFGEDEDWREVSFEELDKQFGFKS